MSELHPAWKKARVVELYGKGIEREFIGERLGLSDTQVADIVRKAGATVNKRPWRRNPPELVAAVVEAVQAGARPILVAERFGITKSRVAGILFRARGGR